LANATADDTLGCADFRAAPRGALVEKELNMKNLTVMILLLLGACSTSAHIPRVDNVPDYGSSGAGHAP
jgi:hypothetical protein